MSWRKRFEALIDELKSHPDIEVYDAELKDPATDEDIATAAQSFGHALPADVEAFYREMNGAKITWSHEDPAYQALGAHGSIYLFDAKTTFRKDWEGDDYGNKPYRPFDWPQDEYYAGFNPDGPGEIWWTYDTSGDARFMAKTTFSDYLEALLESRGWGFWQEMYLYDADLASSLGATVEQTEGRMQAVLPKLFASFDVSKVGNAGALGASKVDQLDQGEAILVYRPGDLPDELTAMLPADAGPRGCAYWIARHGSKTIAKLMAEVPEPDIDHVSEGIALVKVAVHALTQTFQLAELLRPEEVPKGGRMTGGNYSVGFHTAPGDQIEAWLRDQGCRLIAASEILGRILLLSVKDAEGNPVRGLKKSSHVVNAGFRYAITEAAPGIYALGRDDDAHRHFDLVLEGEGDDERRVELKLEELPKTGVFSVTI